MDRSHRGADVAFRFKFEKNSCLRKFQLISKEKTLKEIWKFFGFSVNSINREKSAGSLKTQSDEFGLVSSMNQNVRKGCCYSVQRGEKLDVRWKKIRNVERRRFFTLRSFFVFSMSHKRKKRKNFTDFRFASSAGKSIICGWFDEIRKCSSVRENNQRKHFTRSTDRSESNNFSMSSDICLFRFWVDEKQEKDRRNFVVFFFSWKKHFQHHWVKRGYSLSLFLSTTSSSTKDWNSRFFKDIFLVFNKKNRFAPRFILESSFMKKSNYFPFILFEEEKRKNISRFDRLSLEAHVNKTFCKCLSFEKNVDFDKNFSGFLKETSRIHFMCKDNSTSIFILYQQIFQCRKLTKRNETFQFTHEIIAHTLKMSVDKFSCILFVSSCCEILE